MARLKPLGAMAGMAAACAMAATPASAAELPTITTPATAFTADPVFDVFTPEAETAENFRRRGFRRGRRHRGRIGAGDVLAGVLIIGGIAAIASAASNNNKRDRRDRDYDYRERDRDRDRNRDNDRRGDNRFNGGSGIDNAVSQCVNRIERDVRVEGVDSVDRNGEGWRVTGSLYNGERFTCRIGNNGQVDDVDFGGDFTGASASGEVDGQYSDDRYADARRAQANERSDTQFRATLTRPTPLPSDQPIYPGGPLPGETLDVDGDLGG